MKQCTSWLSLIVLVVLVALLSACGADSDSSAAAGVTPTSNTSMVSLISTATPAHAVKPTATHAKPTPTPVPPTPTPAPVQRAQPTPTLAPKHTGVNGNPWGYDFDASGSKIYSPAADFCTYFTCVSTFWTKTNGYVVECADTHYSHSGGVSGACSHNGGVAQILYSH